MIDRKLQLELLTRPRLARIAGPSGAHLLSALFERSRPSDVWIDAPQFRIDYEDQRDTIQDLSSKRFVVTSWDGDEKYRLSLPALALVDSESACSLLNIIDRLLAYLVRQYKAQRDQRIPVARICKDLQLSRESIVTALRYLVDTPAIGTRASGDPGSDGWWLTPMESSLDYPSLDTLLLKLAEWMEHGDPHMQQTTSLLSTSNSHESKAAPPTRFDRLVHKIKNHAVFAWILLAFIALAMLANSLDAIASIISRILSMF